MQASNDVPLPRTWRLLLGFALAPLVPAVVHAGSQLDLLFFAIILGGYLPTLILGIPAYLLLRKRVRPRLVTIALVGGFIAVIPWLLVDLDVILNPPGPDDDGERTIFFSPLDLSHIFTLGCLGGIVFWFSTIWRDPRFKADADPYTAFNDIRRPSVWHMFFGFVLAPAVSLIAYVPLVKDGGPPFSVVIPTAYLSTLFFGVPAYFLLRKRTRRLITVTLAGGLIAIAPWILNPFFIFELIARIIDSALEGQAVSDSLLDVYQPNILTLQQKLGYLFGSGCLSGFVFWLSMIWHPRRFEADITS